jgi:hypothetical protein
MLGTALYYPHIDIRDPVWLSFGTKSNFHAGQVGWRRSISPAFLQLAGSART